MSMQSTVLEPSIDISSHRRPIGIGARLSHARHSFGLSLEEIGQDIKIRPDILQALEQGAFERIEEPLYRTLMVRTYAEYLGMDWSALQDEYLRESVYRPSTEPIRTAPAQGVCRSDLMIAPRLLKHALLSVWMIAVLFYLMVLAAGALQRPTLIISNPPDNFLSATKTIRIEGAVSSDAMLAINGQDVSKTKEGKFYQEVTLSEGVNMIRISAAKRYSKETVVTRRVMYEAPSVPLTFNEKEYDKTAIR